MAIGRETIKSLYNKDGSNSSNAIKLQIRCELTKKVVEKGSAQPMQKTYCSDCVLSKTCGRNYDGTLVVPLEK